MFKKSIILAAFAASCAFAPLAAAQEKLKIGFVYLTPVGDAGWTYQHDLGRQALERAMGDKVEVTYIEGVPEGPDAERVINGLARRGNDLIFAASFGYMEPMLKVAARYKDKTFEHATGYKLADNMGNYSPRFYEGRYLGGMAAGQVTKTNVIGYVAAFPIAEVVRGINAFALGAQSVNPDVTVKVIWINSWHDPVREREAAETLLAQGADVVTHHTDSPAPVQAAQERGKFAVGYHSDMKRYGKDAQVAAVIHEWEDFYVKRAQEVMDGTWTSRSAWEGIADGMVDVVLDEDMLGADMSKKIMQKRADIASGKFHPFQGPLKNNDGEEIVAAGEVLSDKHLLEDMFYYVMGVEGKVPQ